MWLGLQIQAELHGKPQRAIIFFDIRIRLVEQIVVFVELVFKQDAAEGLLNFAFTAGGLLPFWEANVANDFVNLGDDFFNDGRGLVGADFVEEFGQGGLGAALLFFSVDFLFGLQHFSDNLEQVAQIFQAVDKALFKLVFYFLQTQPQLNKDGVILVLLKPFGNFFSRFLSPFGGLDWFPVPAKIYRLPAQAQTWC